MERIVWPAYLDSSKTRGQGRRVPEDVAVDSPDAREVARAAKQVGYEIQYEPEKEYPRSWWEKKGRVTVETEEEKGEVLRAIAVYIDIIRDES